MDGFWTTVLDQERRLAASFPGTADDDFATLTAWCASQGVTETRIVAIVARVLADRPDTTQQRL